MIRFIRKRDGFTLMEFLMTLVLTVLVTAAAMAVYLMSVTTWKEGTTQIALQREASTAMEKMVRGVDGRNGIREAYDIAIPSNTIIRYRSGIDAVERSFYLNGSDVMYDPDTSINGGEVSITDKARAVGVAVTQGLIFTRAGNLITIKLGLRDSVRGKDIDVDLSTNIKLRN